MNDQSKISYDASIKVVSIVTVRIVRKEINKPILTWIENKKY